MQKEQNRKSPRLSAFDYSSGGAYFLTICAKAHRCIFSHVVGGGVLDAPACKLTSWGRVLEKTLLSVAAHQQGVLTVDSYVIMPNHVHMIVCVSESAIVSSGASGTPPPTKVGRNGKANAVIPAFISTWKRFCNRAAGIDLFQRSYYDHVIRDVSDYMIHLHYIEINPAKWAEDALYQAD